MKILSILIQEQFNEIQSDEALRYSFNKRTKSLCVFWLKLRNEQLALVNEALNVLLPFTTTYMCESGFSALTITKIILRN